MPGYIYKITNLINNKLYIGKTTTSISKRYSLHKWTTKNRFDNHSHIHNAMRKFGIDNFRVDLLEECSLDILNERERYWINILNTRDPTIGYNICKGGEGGPGGPMFKGHRHSQNTRLQMSQNRKGKNNSNFGNHWTQSVELRTLHRKLSLGENNGMYGKHHSIQTKNKISEANSNRVWVHKDSVMKHIKTVELSFYLENGWIKGMGPKQKIIK